MQIEQKEIATVTQAARRKSGKFGDIFADVTEGNNLTVADDEPLLTQRS